MPKRPGDKYNTLLVRFYEDVADKEAHSMLAWLGISGTRVSSLIRRWAVEVPFWKEDEFVQKLYASELVECVHGVFNKSEMTTEEPGGEQQDV